MFFLLLGPGVHQELAVLAVDHKYPKIVTSNYNCDGLFFFFEPWVYSVCT